MFAVISVAFAIDDGFSAFNPAINASGNIENENSHAVWGPSTDMISETNPTNDQPQNQSRPALVQQITPQSTTLFIPNVVVTNTVQETVPNVLSNVSQVEKSPEPSPEQSSNVTSSAPITVVITSKPEEIISTQILPNTTTTEIFKDYITISETMNPVDGISTPSTINQTTNNLRFNLDNRKMSFGEKSNDTLISQTEADSSALTQSISLFLMATMFYIAMF